MQNKKKSVLIIDWKKQLFFASKKKSYLKVAAYLRIIKVIKFTARRFIGRQEVGINFPIAKKKN